MPPARFLLGRGDVWPEKMIQGRSAHTAMATAKGWPSLMHGSADVTASPGAEIVLAGLPAGAAELPTWLPTRFTRLGCIHGEGPAGKLLALEPLHGRGGRRVLRHFDKAKPPGTAGVAIRHDMDPVHHPIGLTELTQVLFCRRKGEMAHKNIHAEVLCMMKSLATSPGHLHRK